jgi:bifunctional non-homologous end joining protein LigD
MIRLPVEPMLAAPAPAPQEVDGHWQFNAPFLSDSWTYEPKLDGVRCIAVRENGKVLLYARSGRLVNSEFPVVAAALRDIPEAHADFVVDGEIIAYDESGQTSFNTLQRRQLEKVRLKFYAFDVLYTSAQGDIQRWPWESRRGVLETLLASYPDAVRPEAIEITPSTTSGTTLWQLIVEQGMEGVIAKPLSSVYRQGQRGPWIKMKVLQRREAVVVGFTSGEGTRNGLFGALVLAEPTESGWKYAGKVGTGFTIDAAAKLLKQMRPLITTESAFERRELYRIKTHLGPRTVTWVRPRLRATVEFSELTPDGVPRFPSFKGITE